MGIRWTGKSVVVTDYKTDTIKRYDISSPEGKSALSKLFIILGALYAGIGLFVLILLNTVFYFIFFRNPAFAHEDMSWTLWISIGVPGIFVVLGVVILVIGLHIKKKYRSLALGEEQSAGFCHLSDKPDIALVPDRQPR